MPIEQIYAKKQQLGKTLIIGANPNALECALILNAFKCNVTVMMEKSNVMPCFDQQMAELLQLTLLKRGIRFLPKIIRHCATTNRLCVEYRNVLSKVSGCHICDTVAWALDAKKLAANTKLCLLAAGIKINWQSHANINGDFLQKLFFLLSDAKNCTMNAVLMHNAKLSGQLLAHSVLCLIAKQLKPFKVKTVNIPHAVFLLLNYAYMGLSVAAAVKKYGKENTEVHSINCCQPMNLAKSAETCDLKIISRSADDQTVYGFHHIGPNADQLLRPLACAMFSQTDINLKTLLLKNSIPLKL